PRSHRRLRPRPPDRPDAAARRGEVDPQPRPEADGAARMDTLRSRPGAARSLADAHHGRLTTADRGGSRMGEGPGEGAGRAGAAPLCPAAEAPAGALPRVDRGGPARLSRAAALPAKPDPRATCPSWTRCSGGRAG